MIVTYDRQNIFIIQATESKSNSPKTTTLGGDLAFLANVWPGPNKTFYLRNLLIFATSFVRGKPSQPGQVPM